MKFALVMSVLFASLASQAQMLPIRFTIEGAGSIGPKSTYKTLGTMNLPTAAQELSMFYGGYDAVYAYYQRVSAPVQGDLFAQAKAFQNFIVKNYGLNVDAETFAMKMAFDQLLATRNDSEIKPILDQVSPHLSFQQKVGWLAQLGGVFARDYDDSRTDVKSESSKGAVSLRQLISAAQTNGKAGVCRDIHAAIAQLATEMGLKAYTQQISVVGDSHAVTVIQDPSNPNRVYTINYANVTSNESTSSTLLNRQDGTIPQVGIQAEYHGSRGQYLSAFPTSLGMSLNDMAGGNPGDWDKLLRNYDNQVTAVGDIGTAGIQLGAGYARTEEGNDVVGAIFRTNNKSKNLAGRMGLVVYQETGATSLYGQETQQGIFISGHERVFSDPIRIKTVNGGTIEMRIIGEINLAAQIEHTKIVGYKEGTSIDQLFNARAGGSVEYKSGSGHTRVGVEALATGELGASDIRNEAGLKQLQPQFRDAAISIMAAQLLSKEIEAFLNTDVVIRNPELGSQMRNEVGVRTYGPVVASAAVGREGPLSSTRPAFVPGNIPKYYLEASVSTKNQRLGLKSGVYCLEQDMSKCAVRGSGRLMIPSSGKGLLPKL